MKKISVFVILLLFIFSLSYCHKDAISGTGNISASSSSEAFSGGTNTVFDLEPSAFGQPFPSLSSSDNTVFDAGHEAFIANFVAEPAEINGGLGPIYINTSCVSCHHNDAIGAPTSGDIESSMLVRLSIPGQDAHGGPLAVPGYGLQLQNQANFGVQPEGHLNIAYTEQTFQFPDGESYSLRTPTYTLTNLYTPLPAGYMLSVRFASPMTGLGLIEAVPESEIVANATANASNTDGIKGHINYVYDDASGTMKIGRFGWKCNTPTLLTQDAKAFNQDMGVTSSYFPHDNAAGQPQDDHRSTSDELPASTVNAVLFYSQTLAVPGRRNINDPTVKLGEALFTQIKCASCHKPTLTTEATASVAYSSSQVIHPYTDLLVHDMGPGLADGRPDFQASGSEWRTAPLWGIGLYPIVNYPAFYLHDGRARTLTEAIMWHGGEAEGAVTAYKNLPKASRDAILAFLNSL